MTWLILLVFSWGNQGVLLLLKRFFIHEFVIGSKIGDVACYTLGGDVGAFVDGCTLIGCTTGSILIAGASGWVMINVSVLVV